MNSSIYTVGWRAGTANLVIFPANPGIGQNRRQRRPAKSVLHVNKRLSGQSFHEEGNRLVCGIVLSSDWRQYGDRIDFSLQTLNIFR